MSTLSCLSSHPGPPAWCFLCSTQPALFIFIALGNILALCLSCQKDKKINSTAVYLFHLAVSDLLFTLTLPGKITYYMLDFSWPFGDDLCRLTKFIMYLNTYGGGALLHGLCERGPVSGGGLCPPVPMALKFWPTQAHLCGSLVLGTSSDSILALDFHRQAHGGQAYLHGVCQHGGHPWAAHHGPGGLRC